ncbi:MAG: hypothetical protein AAF391_01940 [Bacteroidota bacterium]
MIRFFDFKIWGLALVALVGCKKIKPESISIPEYPDLDAFYQDQVIRLDNSSLEKEVSLGGKIEVNTFQMDTSVWKDELSFLEEINPNKSEYLGSFSIAEKGNLVAYTLKEGEKGVLKQLSILSESGEYQFIKGTIHEDKDVYTHHRDIEINLADGVIQSFTIDGYQKMMFKDTVLFGIKGKVQ